MTSNRSLGSSSQRSTSVTVSTIPGVAGVRTEERRATRPASRSSRWSSPSRTTPPPAARSTGKAKAGTWRSSRSPTSPRSARASRTGDPRRLARRARRHPGDAPAPEGHRCCDRLDRRAGPVRVVALGRSDVDRRRHTRRQRWRARDDRPRAGPGAMSPARWAAVLGEHVCADGNTIVLDEGRQTVRFVATVRKVNVRVSLGSSSPSRGPSRATARSPAQLRGRASERDGQRDEAAQDGRRTPLEDRRSRSSCSGTAGRPSTARSGPRAARAGPPGSSGCPRRRTGAGTDHVRGPARRDRRTLRDRGSRTRRSSTVPSPS